MTNDEPLPVFEPNLPTEVEKVPVVDEAAVAKAHADAVMPALLLHCRTIYFQMHEESALTTQGQVWEGSLTYLFPRAGLDTGKYSQVTQRLKAMDCIMQLKRGGGGSASVWRLLKEPVMEDFKFATAKKNPMSAQGMSALQQVRSAHKRLDDLERTVKDQSRLIRKLMNGDTNV